MAPTLTDAQQRTDTTLDGYIAQWNGLPPAQQQGPAGAELKSLIEQLVRERNGDAAWLSAAQSLQYGQSDGAQIREGLDERFPRVDAGLEPASVDSPAPEMKVHPYGSGYESAAADSPAQRAAPAGVDGDIYSAAPGDGRSWLPGNAGLPDLASADTAALVTRDQEIEKLNSELFMVNPAQAWHPVGAQLPSTGINISTLGDTHNQAEDLVGKFTAAVDALNKALDSGSVEPFIAQERDRLRPALDAVTRAASESGKIPGLISIGAIAANDAFHQLRGENLQQRQQIAERLQGVVSRGVTYQGGGVLTPINPTTNGELASLPPVDNPSRLQGVTTAAKEISGLAGSIPAPVTAGSGEQRANSAGNRDTGTGTGTAGGGLPGLGLSGPGGLPAQNAAGVPQLGTGGNGLAAGTGGSKPLDTKEIAALLSQLANSAAPMAQQAAQIPQQLASLPQQAAAIPQQLANAAQQAAQGPSDLLRRLRGDSPDNAKLTPAQLAAAKDADTDRAAATQVAYAPPKPAEAGAVGAPGSPARPHQLDATGKPVDKDGDGKVDASAVPLSNKTVKPFDLTVPAGGQNVQVKGVPDPRIGEMMLNMAQAKDGDSMSVLEAAKAAGMDIKSLGDPLEAKLARVGDAVIGDDKSGIYLGDGKVLTSTGEVDDMDNVLGKTGFVSEIPLPELPDSSEPAAEGKKPDTVTVSDTSAGAGDGKVTPPPPASMSTSEPAGPPTEPAGPPTELAGADPAPRPAAPPVTTAAPPAAAADPPAPAPATTPAAPVAAPVPQAPPAGAPPPPPSAKSGLPKQVAYEGHPLGG